MIRLRTLGALDLRAADGDELRSVLAQPKRLAVLAYLALATPRGAHQRDTLIALFWPELDPEHARNALSQSVHFLRRWLGADIITNRGGDELAANMDLLWCDAVAFDTALDAGRSAEALELCRGDLLQGFHLTDAAAEFDRWIEGERDRLRRRELAALEALASQREEAGDFGGAIIWWQRLAARDPLSSRIALRLMRALASSGDPGAAVQHARVHETLLKNELDVPPDPEVGELVRQLRATQAGGKMAVPPLAATPVHEDAPASVPATPPSDGHRRVFWHRRTTVLVAGVAALAATAAIAVSSATRNTPDAFATTPEQLYLQELLRRGRQAEVSRSLTGLQTARDAYKEAITRDSTFAPGYAGLSFVYSLLAEYNYAPQWRALDSARALAMRAMELDSTLPESRTALGIALGNAGYFEAAEREFKRAIQLGPSNAAAHYQYSILLVALGRAREALQEAERSLALDPFAPRGTLGIKRWAEFMLTGQRAQKQLALGNRYPILQRERGEPWAHAQQAQDFAEEGRCVEAHAGLDTAQHLAPGANLRMLTFVASIFWLCNEHERARKVLLEMKQHPDVGDEGIRVARVHVAFGEKDSAFVWLGHHRWSMVDLAALSGNEPWDPIRADPRFSALLRRLRSPREPAQKSKSS